MRTVFIETRAVIESLDAIKKGVPNEFRQGRRKALGERTKGLSTFFAASNVCAKQDRFLIEVHPDNPANKREALSNSFIALFCDSPEGRRGMIELGEISNAARENKSRFGSDVLNGSFSVSGNATVDYPRAPYRLIQVEQTEKAGQTPTRRVTAHADWKNNLAKYLTTPEAWRGLAIFMLRQEAFEVSSPKSDISDPMLYEKLQQRFTKDVAEFLADTARLRNP